ncbi:MAG TPA: alkaline phosphatase D family protein [Microvirga sp.]|jgi:alkaline phosphatase D|nr:alkaline phosphatase D family protein [Microvirga sp.]
MPITRRRFLTTASAGVTALACPALSRAAARPVITHGVQSGDVSGTSGVVWARADRAARMEVEVSATEAFANLVGRAAIDATPETDFCAKALLQGLPPGQTLFYRVRFRDINDVNGVSEPVVGRLRTAPLERRDVSFVWSGDTVGQGWGIDEARGGMRIYAAMAREAPDFFIHSGDTIYADNPLKAEVTLPDGTLWRNLMTEEKAKVAETLDEFRGQWRYNLLDKNLLAFNREVPMLAQWDDHEVVDNWWPEKRLDADPRYREKSVAVLAVNAARAFHEYVPIGANADEARRVYRKVPYGPLLDVFFLDMRTYRAANGPNRQSEEGPETVFLGRDQLDWLKRELKASRATWKVIAADMPLGLVVYDDFRTRSGSEAIAQGDGPPLGRELEFAGLLAWMKREGVRNTVWLTADVHYTAAHRYDPARAAFTEFDPFWEFVSGPLHAGTFGPNPLDPTFGPEIVFQKAPPPGQFNLSPAAGYQFYGHVRVDGHSEQMVVTLKDAAGASLWATTIDPVRS